ncbi:MAG: hypothetical protein U9R38_03850 [Candidatus Margulisiibacteriota bacterium]|nr:hypothetical protein [Candidatus Margulisiibacteriota bacterium]
MTLRIVSDNQNPQPRFQKMNLNAAERWLGCLREAIKSGKTGSIKRALIDMSNALKFRGLCRGDAIEVLGLAYKLTNEMEKLIKERSTLAEQALAREIKGLLDKLVGKVEDSLPPPDMSY